MKKSALLFFLFSANGLLGYSITYKKGIKPITIVSASTEQSITSYVNRCANARICINAFALGYTGYQIGHCVYQAYSGEWSDFVPPVEDKYCQVLGVDGRATKEQANKAYKREAKKYHPDKNPRSIEAAEKRFKEIVEAHDQFKARHARLDELGNQEFVFGFDEAAVLLPDAFGYSLKNWVFSWFAKKLILAGIRGCSGVASVQTIKPGQTVSFKNKQQSSFFAVYDANGNKLIIKKDEGKDGNWQLKIDKRGNAECALSN